MPSNKISIVAIVLLFLIGCDAPRQTKIIAQRKSPPNVQDACLFRPEFQTKIGTIQAGTAFTVELSGCDELVLLSALHLLGPSGGLPETILPANIDASLSGITLFDLFDEELIHELNPKFLSLLNTAPMGTKSKHGDVVAFLLKNGPEINPFKLAPSQPEIDEPVWLAAQLVDGAPATQKLHRGKFLGIDEGDFVFQFDNPKLELRATSGAPILNSASQVVAINLGGWEDGGFVYGVGNPITRFKAALEAAARQ